MSIVTFWNDDREQTGKTLTSVAFLQIEPDSNQLEH